MVAKETLTSEQRQAVASVTINVTDLNDNNPKFSQAVYTKTVLENRPAHTFVVKVRIITLKLINNSLEKTKENATVKEVWKCDLNYHKTC